jgi:hypothetical protein
MPPRCRDDAQGCGLVADTVELLGSGEHDGTVGGLCPALPGNGTPQVDVDHPVHQSDSSRTSDDEAQKVTARLPREPILYSAETTGG